MKNTRLIEILKTFSGAEMKEFEKFLQASSKNFIVNFFKELKKSHPDFEGNDIDKRKIYSRLYRHKDYNDGLVRRITSDIIKQAKEFLMLKRLYKTDVYRNNCLLMELRDRNLGVIFSKEANKVLGNLEQSKIIDFYYLLNKHLTEIEIYNDLTQQGDYRSLAQLELALESLLIFFLNSSLSVLNTLIKSDKAINSKTIKVYVESFDINYFIESLDKVNHPAVNLIKAVHYSNEIYLDKRKITSFLKLRKILTADSDYISPQQKMVFYTKMINFYNHFHYLNDERFLSEQIQDFNFILQEKLFLNTSPEMSTNLIRSFVNLYYNLSKYNDMKYFLENYSQYFPLSEKDGLLNFIKGIILYGNKKFDQALEKFSKVYTENEHLNVEVKLYRSQSFYELGYIDSFYSEVDSFRHLLKNSKSIKKEFLLSTKNYSVFSFKLMKLNEKNDNFGLLKTKNNIRGTRNLLGKKWLIEKVNEILSGQDVRRGK